MNQITHFKDKYAFLSNFAQAPVVHDGMHFPTVEHAYQAAKTLDEADRHAIQIARTPGMAKRMGRYVKMRPDWEEIKIGIMEDLLRQKFTGRYQFRNMLKSTGNAELIEGNTWGDKFWGAVWDNNEWVGENNLGKLLMKIRDEIA